MPKKLNLIGQTFGKLTVIREAENKNHKTYWLCQCECGNYTTVQTSHLRDGNIKSCGCLHQTPKQQTLLSQLSDQEFIQIVQSSKTYKEIITKCGYSNYSGASQQLVKDRINKLGLSFTPEKNNNSIKRSDEEIFVKNSPVTQAVLRKHYKQGNYSEYKCSICGLEPFWNGKDLSLTLDHINGNNKDDRLENLRWVCPNCDRQLDTFGTKNIKYQKQQKQEDIVKIKNYCIDCGTEIALTSTRCPKCSSIYNGLMRRTTVRPSREELKQLIRSQSFVQIGKQFGVSDNSIRKWCKAENLPSSKAQILAIDDTTWEKL